MKIIQGIYSEPVAPVSEPMQAPVLQRVVVLIEDNPGDARLVRAYLDEAQGVCYQVTHFDTLAQALVSPVIPACDIILLDLSLPDSHGLDTVSALCEAVPDKPIVILSGLFDQTLAIEAVKAGAQDYLIKGHHEGVFLLRAIDYAIERKQTEQKLTHMAHHDTLTGLPNRALFQIQLERALSRAKRTRLMLALMFLDLDRFKSINDTLGHDAGDALLKEVAHRLSACVRASDTVARFAGDEFTLIVEDLHFFSDAMTVAEKVLEVFRSPFVLKGQPTQVTTSIGIATYAGNGAEAEMLITQADAAMYCAKRSGRNVYQFYTESMQSESLMRLEIEQELRASCMQGEFILHYQPIVDVVTKQLVCLEALVRWRHRTRGLVMPSEFIPVAEETSLISCIGAWVLEKACMAHLAWQHSGLALNGVRVAVNVSVSQLREGGLVDTITDILHRSGLDSTALALEITESVMMDNPEHAINILREIHEMGIKIAIDDFGIGYSSLNYLRQLPVDTLKIDRSFIQDIGKDANDESIVKAVISLAQGLGLEAIAEGVETQLQADFLRHHGCTRMQGYLFSPPVPGEEIMQTLRRLNKGAPPFN